MSTALSLSSYKTSSSVTGGKDIRFRIALAAACSAFTFFYLVMEIALRQATLSGPDTLLHIGIGNWVLQNGSFPTVDHFSYTALGRTWRATDWISEIIFAILYRIGHWSAVAEVVTITVGIIAATLAYYFAKRLRLSVALGLTAIIIFLISPHYLARPVIFVYLFLAIWVMVILFIHDHNDWTGYHAFALIPLMALWANVHGSFTLGLVIFYLFVSHAIYVAYREKDLLKVRRLALLFVGVSIAALITPYGVFSALRTVQIMNIPALERINEWHPPNFVNDKYHLAFIIGIFSILLYRGVRLRGPRLLTLLLMTVFALEHARGLGLFSLVVPLLLLRPLSESLPWIKVPDSIPDPVNAFAAKRSGAIAFACALIAAMTGLTMWIVGPQVRLRSGIAPQAAVTAAKLSNLSGNVYNSYQFGGYLVFKGIPTFVDGRVGLYGNRFLQHYFAATSLKNPNEARALMKQYNVRWALLAPSEPIAFMLRADGWKQIYKSRYALVLAKGQ